MLCLLWGLFFFFFPITEENKQYLLWYGLPMLLCCSCFICMTERSAREAVPAGSMRLHFGNLEPEEVEQKPEEQEERRAVPNPKKPKSHQLSLPTIHLDMALWQSLALLWQQAQAWLCPEELCLVWSELGLQGHTRRTKKGCDCIASLVHVPRALKGICCVRNLRSESHFPQSEIFKEVKGLK